MFDIFFWCGMKLTLSAVVRGTRKASINNVEESIATNALLLYSLVHSLFPQSSLSVKLSKATVVTHGQGGVHSTSNLDFFTEFCEQLKSGQITNGMRYSLSFP